MNFDPLHPAIVEGTPIPAAPSWYQPSPEARARFGDIVLTFGRHLLRGDPLADDLVATLAELPGEQARSLVDQALAAGIGSVDRPPRALTELFRQLDEVPVWVDAERLERGGRALLRAGLLGALVFTTYSLPLSYCSPDGVKPLVASGRLVERAPRRLSETARFVVETCRPGGLRRFGEGFKITVRVRLMHAHIRRWLLLQGAWPIDRWGLPINQAHMAGTNVLFSSVFIEGLRRLGYDMPAQDRADLVHLFRYSGLLSGVDPALCAATEEDGLRHKALLAAVTPPPDDDSRALVRALMESTLVTANTRARRLVGRQQVEFMWALSRYLIGPDLADALQYPKTPWGLAVHPIRVVNTMLGSVIPRTRATGDPMYRVGLAIWERLIEQGLAGLPASFDFGSAAPRRRESRAN